MIKTVIVLTVLLFVICAMTALSWEREEVITGLLNSGRETLVSGNFFYGSTRQILTRAIIEEAVIQRRDFSNPTDWYNFLKVSYLYDENESIEGWVYHQPSGGENPAEWGLPILKATLERYDSGFPSTLTFWVADEDNPDNWTASMIYTQVFDVDEHLDLITIESYDSVEDVWVEVSSIDFFYDAGGMLSEMLVTNLINEEVLQDYYLEKLLFDYDEQGRIIEVITHTDFEGEWEASSKKLIEYHESDTGSYDDVCTFLNHYILYLDREASLTMGPVFSGLSYAKIAAETNYSSNNQEWQPENRYVCVYDEQDRIVAVEYQADYRAEGYSILADRNWIAWYKTNIGYDEQGIADTITEQEKEPLIAMRDIRTAYRNYQNEHGSQDGYRVTDAIRDANLKEFVLYWWGFEVVGNPATQFIATSKVEFPPDEGHQIFYDLVSGRWFGFYIDVFRGEDDENGEIDYGPEEYLWTDTERLLLTHKIITSAKDESYPLSGLSITNYPNPFNPETVLLFELPSRQDIELTIYNVKGQAVRNAVRGSFDAGQHRFYWNGRDNNGNDLSSGVYFYHLETASGSESGKMLLLR